MWVTTDQDGTKSLFEKKPTRDGNVWDVDSSNPGEACQLDVFPFNELPSFIQQQQWKDAPIQVKFEIKKK